MLCGHSWSSQLVDMILGPKVLHFPGRHLSGILWDEVFWSVSYLAVFFFFN